MGRSLSPKRGAFFHLCRERRNALFEPDLRIMREARAGLRDRAEHAQDDLRIVRGIIVFLCIGKHDAAPLDAHAGRFPRIAAEERLPQTLQRLWLRHRIGLLLQPARDNAGVTKVQLHPVGGIARHAARDADARCCRLVLRLPVERVHVPARAKVEKASNGSQKGEGVRELLRGCGRRLRQARQPSAGVLIAQSAGTLLDVRLQVKEGVAIARVPLGRKLQQARADGLAIAFEQLRYRGVQQLFHQRGIARKRPQIQQRDGELRVLRIEALAL